MKKKAMIAVMTLMVAGTGIFTATQAFAEDTNTQNPLVQKISQKFKLNQTEVQAVFDQERTEREAQMESEFTKTLTQAVIDGKLTEAQKQLILDKRKEMLANRPDRQSMQDMTADERKAQMTAKKAEIDAWAKQNGIDVQYLMGRMGGHGGRGMPDGGQMQSAPAN